jgi:hypothetical protein
MAALTCVALETNELIAAVGWGKNGKFRIPTKPEPSQYGSGVYSRNLVPFVSIFCFFANRDVFYSPAISALLSRCSPPAVAWVVSLIIVNAIYRMSLAWFSTHVVQKRTKTFKPRFTDSYSSSSVVSISCLMLICASLFHVAPYSIFRSYLATACIAVCFAVGFYSLSVVATTAFAMASQNVGRSKFLDNTTLAFTNPCSYVFAVRSWMQSSQSIKYFSSQIISLFFHSITPFLHCTERDGGVP